MAPPTTKKTARATVALFLTGAKDAQLDAELRKLVMDPADAKKYIGEFASVIAPESGTTHSFAKLYHSCAGARSCDVKTKVFGSNATSIMNETVRTISLDATTTLVSTKMTPIRELPQTASSIELVTRFGFALMNYPNWTLNIDLVRTLANPLEFAQKLPVAKAGLVDVSLDAMTSDAYDHVVTTLSRIEPIAITRDELEEMVDEVTSVISGGEGAGDPNAATYQSAIHSLAGDIFRDAMMVAQYKQKSGFKRLCSNTVEMSRPIYFKQVLPKIGEFYMTDKIDGARAMLVIDEVYRRSGHRRIYLGVNIKAVADQVYEIVTFSNKSSSKTIETDHTVLDVEMVTDKKGTRTFYCFDVIAFASRKVGNAPFHIRMKTFDNVSTLMAKHELGTVKEFVELTEDGYAKQISDFYKKKRSYEIDGVIFTPKGMLYRDAKKLRKNKFERIFNTDYSSTVSFKWKPLDQLTIDFYLMKHPKKKDSYVLCSGVDMRTFKLLRMRFFDGYVAPVSPNSQKYFPIQFETYDGEFDNVWTPTKEDLATCAAEIECGQANGFEGMVGEFAFAGKKGRFDKPRLLRLRADRVQDVAKGEYYGNALRYAELIWHSIQFPLTIELMTTSEAATGYFAAEDSNEWFKAQRNFNSFVKSYLLETYMQPTTAISGDSDGPARIMDLACGKGQDIARAIDTGSFDEVVAVDRDVDAIYELLERKYNLRVKRRDASANIHVKRAELGGSADELIKQLKLPSASADAMMINFAIHYLCHGASPDKKEPIIEFAKLAAYYAKPGSRLMITTFNGEDVFNALNGKKELAIMDDGQLKYSIKKKFTSQTLTNLDQQIDVLLPFSAGRYYSEYLVNYEYLQSVMEAQGFKLVVSDSFESLLRSYKKQNKSGYAAMSTADREWVALYGYMIFERE